MRDSQRIKKKKGGWGGGQEHVSIPSLDLDCDWLTSLGAIVLMESWSIAKGNITSVIVIVYLCIKVIDCILIVYFNTGNNNMDKE